VSITPEVKAHPIPLGGYGAREGKPATGVHDPVYARALVLTQGPRKIALVSTDLCFIPAGVKEAVLKQVGPETGLDANTLLLAATHCHSAPEAMALNPRNVFSNPRVGIFDPWLFEFTVERIAQAVRQAQARLRPARVGVAAERVPGLNRNRRGDETVDEEMTVLKVVEDSGRPQALAVFFTAHVTIFGPEMMEVSGGWAGVLERTLEERLGGEAVVLFFNGAEGDQTTAGAEGANAFERVEHYGRRVAAHALRLAEQAKPLPEVTLRSLSADLPLPERRASPFFAQIAGREYGVPEEQLEALLHQLFPSTAALMAMQVGDLVLLAVPGEPIAQIGLALKAHARRAGAKQVAIVGLANDYIGYILTPEEYREGGYEATVSFYGDQLGPTLRAGMERLVENLLAP